MITLFLSFIFALRYFDRFYIKFLLVLTFLGILLDIFWIVMKFKVIIIVNKDVLEFGEWNGSSWNFFIL
jgi:hypothetical protein